MMSDNLSEKIIRLLSVVVTAIFLSCNAFAQNTFSERIERIQIEMDELSRRCPEYAESIDISVGRMRLTELLRTVAQMKKVNLSVRDDFDCVVSCSFSRSRVNDLIVFLCREYNLDIEVYGNIVSVFRYVPPAEAYVAPEIFYSPADSLLSFQFEDKRLCDVTDRISSSTGESIIVPASIRDARVSATASRVTVGDALEIISRSNGLELFVVKGDHRMWCIGSLQGNKDAGSRKRMPARSYGMSSDTTSILSLKHRSIDKVIEIIPEELKGQIRIIESDEMNAFIIHGSPDRVAETESFIRRIDVPIPLVEIDVMIVESSRSNAREIGIEAGVSPDNTESQGQAGSGVDFRLGSATTLQLLNKINGFSSINLGNAAERLYVDIKLLEEAGVVKVESTPKLATLNGQQAVLSKGETTYYKEVSSSFYSSQTTVQNQSYIWKEVNADLVITITPHVSLDSLVTLNIDIQQNEFGPKSAADAPPDINKRGFKSTVRISDGDIVLLGGIDTSSDKTSAKGLPWLARVPVLRWLGGKDKRAKSEVKMNVFIRPKIIN